MSKYTTGELAKICNVTVRTVQYYDTRGILVPNELSEGGRRLYSDDDLKRMKIICFLRELGISINTISELLAEENPGSVISILIDQQEQELREELAERQEKLGKLTEMKQELKNVDRFSVESIGDIALIMANKKTEKCTSEAAAFVTSADHSAMEFYYSMDCERKMADVSWVYRGDDSIRGSAGTLLFQTRFLYLPAVP